MTKLLTILMQVKSRFVISSFKPNFPCISSQFREVILPSPLLYFLLNKCKSTQPCMNTTITFSAFKSTPRVNIGSTKQQCKRVKRFRFLFPTFKIFNANYFFIQTTILQKFIETTVLQHR